MKNIEIRSDVTILIGQNGTGKSRYLQELYDYCVLNKELVTCVKYTDLSYTRLFNLSLISKGDINNLDKIIQYLIRAFPYKERFFSELTYENLFESELSDGENVFFRMLYTLFSSEEKELILFDCIDSTLHPFVCSLFAEAMIEASKTMNKQIVCVTYNPSLISQFDLDQILVFDRQFDVENQQYKLKKYWLSDNKKLEDLWECYKVGYIFMNEILCGQSHLNWQKPDFWKNEGE